MIKIKETTAKKLGYREVSIGDKYEFKRELSKEDVKVFAELTGDMNPLHVNEEFGRKSKFGKNVVHGMLAGALFSRLVGMYCPGENCLYVSQTLNFRNPLFYGDEVTVRGTVISKNDGLRMVVLKTEIIKEGTVVINGEAKTIVL